ncbi:MAG TPA: hypothetical protein VGE01_04215 [Fimbriimonas sp.]
MSDYVIAPSDPYVEDGWVTLSASVRHPVRGNERLWFQLPEEYADLATDLQDPFVYATLHDAMGAAGSVRVEGRISEGLAASAEEYSAFWSTVAGNRYRPLQVVADEEVRLGPYEDGYVAAFSGGVDACHAVWRNRCGLLGQRSKKIRFAAAVHGFDVPIDRPDRFDPVLASIRLQLSSLGLDVVPVRTNFRQFPTTWEHSHLSSLVGCLACLNGGVRGVLIGSSGTYRDFVTVWGSNPISDRMLSHANLHVHVDGYETPRIEKIRDLAAWPESLAHLRVCWSDSETRGNCGKCVKCLRTALALDVFGLLDKVPFDAAPDLSDLRSARPQSPYDLVHLREILEFCEEHRIDRPWRAKLKKIVARGVSSVTPGRALVNEVRIRAAVRTRLRSLRAGGSLE